MIKGLENLVNSIVFMLAFILIAWFILTITESSPLVYTNVPFPVVTENITQGSEFHMIIGRCATKEIPYVFTHSIINNDTKEVRHLPGATITTIAGCSEVGSVPIKVPIDLEPGNYYSRFLVVVEGRFRTFNLEVYSEVFEVSEAFSEDKNE
jgi:hypothetical protein